MFLSCRFSVREADATVFAERARRALALLTAQPGCTGGELGRSTEEADRWVLTVRFESVVAYRRAMSPFEVREHVVPLLSSALTDEPAAYETTALAVDGTVTELTSLLAADHEWVRLGEAAGPDVPPR